MVTLTFNEDGRTLYGTSPQTAALVMTAMGADAVGVNCSTGPDKMGQIVEQMCEYTSLPIVAKPNAGLPRLVDGVTAYDMEPEEFAAEMVTLARQGVDVLGGCCGTTPEHIKALVNHLEKHNLREALSYPKRQGKVVRRALSTERNVLPIALDGAFKVIGERINPTGKKALQEQLREGNLELVGEMAEAQVEGGAAILDVNMGMNGIDEKAMMCQVVNELTLLTDTPLSIDSSYVEVIEAALRIYPGRALINSISMEKEKMQRLIPIAKKYGAMFILLPLSDAGLPKDIQEKKEIIHKILAAGETCGLTKEDVIVDGLVATIGANKMAAVETLETVRYCRQELEVATACGLSNISFGLPERAFVNSNFMAMAIMNGLTMAIANPSQDLLMHAVFAADLLMNKPEADSRYIERVTDHKVSVVSGQVDSGSLSVISSQKDSSQGVAIPLEHQGDEVFEAVVKGKKQKAKQLVEGQLKQGKGAQEIIDNSLIPAIMHVGDLYEKQRYYLPQLIASAETMELSIDYLEPVLAQSRSGESLGTIVMATVEHDIHDIGKNLVSLMLKNYGYQVIDLGKDVPAERILEAAERENADIIGLSALMTTTMMEMKKVVDMVKERQLDVQVIIGGAVITQGFADEIGADGYSKDAQEAVGLVGRLLKEKKG
jgi:5-methyltetrahydrofolate--homocysteine methyltransferase